jgi:hypothetical protein
MFVLGIGAILMSVLLFKSAPSSEALAYAQLHGSTLRTYLLTPSAQPVELDVISKRALDRQRDLHGFAEMDCRATGECRARLEAWTVSVEGWRDSTRSLDACNIAGFLLGFAAAFFFAKALRSSREVIATTFRGYSPADEDPLFEKYTRVGRSARTIALLVVPAWVVWSLATRSSSPSTVAVGPLVVALICVPMIWRLGNLLTAPLALARSRDAERGGAVSVAAHDVRVQQSIAQLESQIAAKRAYVGALQAAASPANLISAAQVEMERLQGWVAHEKTRLLGGFLRAAQERLRAARSQIRNLHVQGAPAEAFTSVVGVAHATRAEIQRIAAAAGWEPWPLQPPETDADAVLPQSGANVVAP